MHHPPRSRPASLAAHLFAVVLAGCALAAVPRAAAADPPREFTITLAEAEQPELARPRLAALKREAARDGVRLGEVVARVAAEAKHDHGVTLPDVPIDDLSVIELTDLERMAKSDGISLERAIDRYGWQDQFTEATRRIRELLPGQVAGVAIRDGENGERTGWIGFKGDVPDGAVEIARTIPAEVELVGNKGYSEEEIQAEQERVAGELPSGIRKVISYDTQTGVIGIIVDPEAAPSSTAEKAALQAKYTPADSRVPGITFDVSVQKTGYTLTDAYARGGGLFNGTDGGSVCTMGFNVTKNGAHSTTTAGHCAESPDCTIDAAWCKQQYRNHSGDGSTSTSINFKLRHFGHYGDFARYGPGSYTASDTFYYDWNAKRYVNSIAWSAGIYPGKSICKFGRITGATCGTVYQTGLVVNEVHYLVSMNNHHLAKGDSGGPWYWGNEAHGMSHAYLVYGNGVTRDAFSPVHLIPSALSGWQVRLH